MGPDPLPGIRIRIRPKIEQFPIFISVKGIILITIFFFVFYELIIHIHILNKIGDFFKKILYSYNLYELIYKFYIYLCWENKNKII